VPPGYKVTLFSDKDFQGRSKVLYADAGNLSNPKGTDQASRLDFYGITSSIIVEAVPVVYANNNYTGAFQVLDVGSYDYTTNLSIGNDQISSIKIPPGYMVTLFEHGINQGRSKVLYADTATLPDFDNITSAILVGASPYTSLTTATQAGELKLEASQHSDLPGLTNTTNTELRISLSAKGQWCLYNGTIPQYAVFNAKTDWKGMVQLAPSIYANHKWRKAGAPAGCVLAEILDTNGFIKDILAAPDTLDLPPGHKVVFVINDDVNWYADNSGQISLSYSCKPKDPKGVLAG
jgi:hypothetical protein